MDTQPRNRSTRRQPRRLASAGIAVLAITGLVTACTAASAGVGTTKRAPSRYPTGAVVQTQAKTQATTSADSPQSLQVEQQIRRSGGTITVTRTQNEYELTRSEHQHGK